MWQAVYAELKGEGLEIIAVAFDTAGKAAMQNLGARVARPTWAALPLSSMSQAASTSSSAMSRSFRRGRAGSLPVFTAMHPGDVVRAGAPIEFLSVRRLGRRAPASAAVRHVWRRDFRCRAQRPYQWNYYHHVAFRPRAAATRIAGPERTRLTVLRLFSCMDAKLVRHPARCHSRLLV